ncbi:MAG TPA: hypothetical protein ENJ35_09805 [Gammaproteobacteria bacterium]|nr:hypothetical protein [Gammaproteobacteria bacterium]
MNDEYRATTDVMEQNGVNQDYIIGWQGGYLGHPEREEQRITEAYEAGYADGGAKNTEGWKNWKS